MSDAKDGEPQMWLIRSDEDGYFAGIVVARSEAEARQMAWAQFTGDDHRPEEDGAPSSWRDYHTDASELHVEPIGTEYYGADGEGNLEFD